MIDKILVSTAIVSDELYVERDADRQLNSVINGMARPAYVLVARQMGKTNLLLHMKRRREREKDVVIYVDLSERFESTRACFRHIIDLAIETRPDLFGQLETSLIEHRLLNLDASLEYGRALRGLLAAIGTQKLIIVLDEVDSLINASYGDALLSQVRSTYFTRASFSVYKQLTYVLSGVADPTDLIRDKNISPFNIGEKIYLDDFTLGEVATLASRASISFSRDVVERVFWWAAGNPRMTWDLLSDLESTGAKEVSYVDQAVERLYLAAFDRPPVDHIRSLVADDKFLHSGIMSIRFNKGDAVDQKTRSRLFLAGVTSNPSESPRIRNPIVDRSLSEHWMVSAAPQISDPLIAAVEHFIGRRYSMVISELSAFRRAGNELPTSSSAYLGISFYKEDEIGSAIEELEAVQSSLRGEIATMAAYFLASAYLKSDQAATLVDKLLVDAEASTGSYRIPLLTLIGVAYYRLEVGGDDPRQMAIRDALCAELDRGDDPIAEEMPAAFYGLAMAALGQGDMKRARQFLELAAKSCMSEFVPGILMSLYSLLDKDEKGNMALSARSVVFDHALRIDETDRDIPTFSTRVAGLIVSCLLECKFEAEAIELLVYLTNQRALGDTVLSVILDLEAPMESELPEQSALLLALGRVLAKAEYSTVEKLRLYRRLASVDKDDSDRDARENYLSELSRITDDDVLDQTEMTYPFYVVQQLIAEQRNDEAEAALDNILSIKPVAETPILKLLYLFQQMGVLVFKGDGARAKQVASEMLQISSRNATLFEDEEHENLRGMLALVTEQARATLRGGDLSETPRVKSLALSADPFRHIGRNQRVTIVDENGDVRTTKFKFVSQLLRAKKVNLLEVHDR